MRVLMRAYYITGSRMEPKADFLSITSITGQFKVNKSRKGDEMSRRIAVGLMLLMAAPVSALVQSQETIRRASGQGYAFAGLGAFNAEDALLHVGGDSSTSVGLNQIVCNLGQLLARNLHIGV